MKRSITPSNDGSTEDIPRNPTHGKRRNTSRPAEAITGSSSERRGSKHGTSPELTTCRSHDTSKSGEKPTHTTQNGRATLRNVSMFAWRQRSKENAGCSLSGKSNEDSARSATKRSPRSADGIAITSSGDPKEDQTEPKIASFSIPPVISKFIAKEVPSRNRVPSIKGGVRKA